MRLEGCGKKETVAFVGEAPSKDDLKFGKPWSGGRVAHLFADQLARMGWEIDEFWTTNFSKYYLEDRKEALIASEENLSEMWHEMQDVAPRVIVPLGAIATRAFGIEGDLGDIHGTFRYSTWPEWSEVTFFPMYNPGLCLRDPSALANMHDDLIVLRKYLKTHTLPDFPAPIQTMYYPAPVQGDWSTVAIDTEGYPNNPWCATYSWAAGQAAMVWENDPAGLGILQSVIDSADTLVMHNALWDIPVLRSMGIEVGHKHIDDTMLMSYALQLTPQGLKSLAYRYCGMKMRDYASVVFPAEQDLAKTYLDKVEARATEWVEWDRPEPELVQNGTTGKWEIKKPQKLSTRLKAIRSKVAKDPATSIIKLWEMIPPNTRKVAEDVCGPMPFFHFIRVHHKDALEYACADADATFRLRLTLLSMLSDRNLEGVYYRDAALIPMLAAFEQNGIKVDKEKLNQQWNDLQADAEVSHKQIVKYNGGKWLNPSSTPQLAELLYGRLKLPAVKRSKTTRAPSCDEKTLAELAPLHPVIPVIQRYREIKNLQKFCALLPKFVDGQGRVHTRIKPTRVVSGRYATEDPNLLAIPARTEEGNMIRKAFVASGQGWIMGSADLDQIEMKMMAHLSRDKRMVQWIKDGVDLHTYTAAELFGIDPKDVDKKRHRTPAKSINFGLIYGISSAGLYDQCKLNGLEYDQATCQGFIDKYFGDIFPGVRDYISFVHKNLETLGQVRTMNGRVRYLPQVWSSDEREEAEAYRQAVSHVVSGSAQDLMKKAMVSMWEQLGDQDFCRFLLQIHDEIILEAQEDSVDIVEQVVVESLVGAEKLIVPVTSSMKWAYNWGDLK